MKNPDKFLQSIYNIIQRDDDLYTKSTALTELTGLYIKYGYTQDALNLLVDSVKTAKRLNSDKGKSYNPNAACEILVEVVRNYYKMGEKRNALRIISMILDIASKAKKYPSVEIIDIARVLHENGAEEKALHIVGNLLKATPEGYLLSKDKDVLLQVVEIYCDMGLQDRAEEITDKIVPSYFTYGEISSLRSNALSYIAKSYADIGLRDKAYQLINDIHLQFPQERNQVIGLTYAELDEWEKAFYELKEINKIYTEFILINCPYIEIAKIALRKNRKDVALESFNELTTIMKDYDWYYMKSELLIEMADIYLSMGEDLQADEALKHALENIERFRTDNVFYLPLYVETLSKTVNLLFKMENLAEAKKLLHKAFKDIIVEYYLSAKIESLIIIFNTCISNNEIIKSIVEIVEIELMTPLFSSRRQFSKYFH